MSSANSIVDELTRPYPNAFSLIAPGLDSLSADRLSIALQPFLSVTQLQLLGHMTFVELEAHVHRQAEEMTPTM
jgi:hypothetical protein